MQQRPRTLAVVSLAVMIALLVPAFALRLDTSDAGNDPANVELPPRLRPARARLRPRVQRSADASRQNCHAATKRRRSRRSVPQPAPPVGWSPSHNRGSGTRARSL